MKFKYLARTIKGEVQAGVVEAPNEGVALKKLQEHNLTIIRLDSEAKKALLARDIKIFERITRKDIFIFFRQLAILIEADVPLVQSLKTLGNQTKKRMFRQIILRVAEDIDGGMSFSKALSKYPKAFSRFIINLIKVGEVAGRLQETLTYLADYIEREYYFISKVRGAMIYPVFILGVFLVVGVLVVVMVIPSLTAILIESGEVLPLSTRIVIWVSDFIRAWGLFLLALVVVSIPLFVYYRRTGSGRFFLDRLKLKIPIFGGIIQQIYLARFSDNLSILLKGGVTIIQSLNIAGEAVGNYAFERIIIKARDSIKSGGSISAVLSEHKEFPPLFYQMIRTGEKTGKLDSILEKLNKFYSKEVENIVNNLSQLIEPLLLVFLGIGVSILVFAVFMPIYNLAGSL